MASLKMSRVFAILCAFVAESLKLVGFYAGNTTVVIIAYLLQMVAVIGIMKFSRLIKEEKEDKSDE